MYFVWSRAQPFFCLFESVYHTCISKSLLSFFIDFVRCASSFMRNARATLREAAALLVAMMTTKITTTIIATVAPNKSRSKVHSSCNGEQEGSPATPPTKKLASQGGCKVGVGAIRTCAWALRTQTKRSAMSCGGEWGFSSVCSTNIVVLLIM